MWSIVVSGAHEGRNFGPHGLLVVYYIYTWEHDKYWHAVGISVTT